jgi:hypothetical protein
VSGLHLLNGTDDLTAGERGLGYPSVFASGRTYLPAESHAEFTTDFPAREVRVNYSLFSVTPSGSLDTSLLPFAVAAAYRFDSGLLLASFVVVAPGGTANFTLRVNNSVPSSRFPLTFNDSIPAPSGAPSGEGLVWSLQNWLMGDGALLQFDFTSPLSTWGGRTAGGSAWIAFEAPPGAAGAAFPFRVLAPGTTLFRDGEPHLYKAPIFRAGGYLEGAPRTPGLRIFSDFAFGDFPWLREASGLPASAFANSSELPALQDAVVPWLRANTDFVVVTNASNDPLSSRYPELLTGGSTRNFSLVFDAGGGPGSLGHGLVWVYRVNGPQGVVRAFDGAWLTFAFDQAASGANLTGLGLMLNGTEVVLPASGFGLPRAVVNGAAYAAGSAFTQFVNGSSGLSLFSTYRLYPALNGSLNWSALPLIVHASYAYADLVLSVAFHADPALPTDNVTLTCLFEVPTARFPTYLNDTDNTAVTADFPRSYTWAIRNWFLGQGAAIQADFTDPNFLWHSRHPAGNSSLEYEAPAGALTLAASLRILPPALAPQV